MSLHPVDIAVLVYVAYGAYHGIKRGLSGELARILCAVAALLVSWRYFPLVGELVREHTRITDTGPAYLLGFAVILVAAYAALSVLRLAFRAIVEFKFREPLEKFGGALAGGARAGLVALVLILLVGLWKQEVFRDRVATDSVAGRIVQDHFVSAYEDFAAQHPDLKLPRFTTEESEWIPEEEEEGEGLIVEDLTETEIP